MQWYSAGVWDYSLNHQASTLVYYLTHCWS